MEQATTIGLDIAKHMFQVHGADGTIPTISLAWKGASTDGKRTSGDVPLIRFSTPADPSLIGPDIQNFIPLPE
jgi:hypothetical protein